MDRALLILAETNVVFGPMIGYAGALVSAITALITLLHGGLENWRPPQRFYRKTSRAAITVLTAVGIVGSWLWLAPENVGWAFLLLVLLAGGALVSFVLYRFALIYFIFQMEVATGPKSWITEPVIGGWWRLPQADEVIRKRKLTVQEFFKGVGYVRDRVWSRISQAVAETAVLVLFIVTVAGMTTVIALGGFLIQVKLSGKPPSATLTKVEAPAAP